ncbi:MAG: ester cyclase [Acidimicrobiia bacterium]|nr:MAG: ester cyclase [Acidimicrobiia bacterium]
MRGGSMSDLKALVRRVYDEVFNEGKVELIDELLAENFVEHEQMPGMPSDREAPKMYTQMARNAFPDFRMTVEEVLQDGNKVIVRGRSSGTHKGEFWGMPPTGNTFDIAFIDILEYDGDKMVGHWGVTDTAAMMEQLGGAAA